MAKPFTMTNGTKQGCPLSPLIFAVVMEPLAEAIRSHPNVKGVEIGKTQHKINLVADDVILTLTDVEQSLMHTTEVLHRFSSVSYYRVNSTKSLILDISISPNVKQKIQSKFAYIWQVKVIQLELSRISQVENSWLGRIVLYKMPILPKILYVVRALQYLSQFGMQHSINSNNK